MSGESHIGLNLQHKKQHWVPESYLHAWTDPKTPVLQKPYVWVFSKDGTQVKKKAPKNLFTETDMYTVQMEKGFRDLRLEKGLSQLEGEFAKIRNNTLKIKKSLSTKEKIVLAIFTAAMYMRTKAKRNHWKMQFDDLYKKMEGMKRFYESISPEQLNKIYKPNFPEKGKGNSMSLEDVRELSDKTIQKMLMPTVEFIAPILLKMNLAVLCTSGKEEFITSDDPCTWYDPEAYKMSPLFQSPALGSETITVSFPVSPKQKLLYSWSDVKGYIFVNDIIVNEGNRITRFHCDESYIVNCHYKNEYWFDPGTPPPGYKD